MNKRALFIALAIVFGIAAYQFYKGSSKKNEASAVTTEPIGVDAQDQQGLAPMLTAYYQLKDAYVKTDAAGAAQGAAALVQATQAFNPDSSKLDASIADMATQMKATIAGEAAKITATTPLPDGRKSFETISTALYDLLRTLHYSGATVYHQYCPMAFNDAGAFWLSNSSEIRNPYFGDEMLECGEVKDSLGGVK